MIHSRVACLDAHPEDVRPNMILIAKGYEFLKTIQLVEFPHVLFEPAMIIPYTAPTLLS